MPRVTSILCRTVFVLLTIAIISRFVPFHHEHAVILPANPSNILVWHQALPSLESEPEDVVELPSTLDCDEHITLSGGSYKICPFFFVSHPTKELFANSVGYRLCGISFIVQERQFGYCEKPAQRPSENSSSNATQRQQVVKIGKAGWPVARSLVGCNFCKPQQRRTYGISQNQQSSSGH